jgi:hypothetical protein
MPYRLIDECSSLAFEFQKVEWFLEDGFLPDTDELFARVERWLIAVRDIAA